jgi:hypothetical protein
MKSFLDESFTENQNRVTFFENRAIYDIMPKNTVEKEGLKTTSRHGAYVWHAG